MKTQARFDLGWMLVILLAVFAVAPLTYPGFFETRSGFLPVFNVTHLSAAPNWARVSDPIHGEGKLPYLLAWPFLQVSENGITALKAGYGLAFLLGALGIYAWTRRWLGLKGGVLAAVVYTYLPWHLSAIYVRGAYAEAWLWAFWPAILWAIDGLHERQLPRRLLAIATGLPLLAATFWIQPGLAILAVPLLLAYGVTVAARQPRRLPRLIGACVVSLSLLWIAARMIPESESRLGEQFLHPYQLLSAAWGDGLSFQLGLAAVGLSIVAAALSISSRAAGAQGTRASEEPVAAPSQGSLPSARLGSAIVFWLGALLVLSLLTLSLSAILWQASGLGVFLAHPWQLLALTGMPLAFLAGSVARLDERLATPPAWAGLVALVVLASYPYLTPHFTQTDPGPEPVALLQPVEADTPQILILDYESQPPTAITPTLTLTLTWQAVQTPDNDYTVFVHAMTEEDGRVAQRDARPCDGECPTNTWQPGAIIVDRHQFVLDTETAADLSQVPTGPYRLAVGLYLLDTGERAIVVGRDDGTVYLDVP